MKGFVLYPTYKIIDGKPRVLLFGKLENGQSFLTVNSARPYFYIEESDLKSLPKENDYEKTNFKNFSNEKLIRVYTEIPGDVPKLRRYLEERGVKCYEADVRFAYRFLIDNNIKSAVEINGEDYEQNEFIDRIYEEPTITPAQFTPKLKVFSIDIETSIDGKNLYSISIYSENFQAALIVHNKKLKEALVFKDEESLLEKFSEIIRDEDPDIITGWSVIDFDLNYLKDKFKQHKIPFILGRTDQQCKIKLESDFFRTSKSDFQGRVVLDAIDLLKGSFIQLENYKLSTAAAHFLKEKKLIDDYNKPEEIESFYKNHPEKLVEYNMNDAKLVLDIIKKTRVLDLSIHRSLLTGMPLDRVNASIASFDSLYLRKLREKNYVAPSAAFHNNEERIKGGYVMDSLPGIYENIIILDFKSLYPSIMRTFNIDPFTFAGSKKGKNLITAPNKVSFRKDSGFLPEIIEELMKEREMVKKEKDELTSYAIKILLNSLFGVLANSSFRFFSTDMANAITHFGQHLIKLTAEKIREKGHEVIYSDSVTANTEIIIKDEEGNISFSKIKNLFKRTKRVGPLGKEYDLPKGMSALTINKRGKSVFKPIKYVMRHRTNKCIYRVWFTNNEFIEVTEDHSLIGYVNANHEKNLKTEERLIEVKPNEIGRKIKSIINLKKIPNNRTKNRGYPYELYLFSGYFIGDGSFVRNKYHQKYNKDYYLRVSTGRDSKEFIKKVIKPLIKKGYIKNYWLSNTRKGDITLNGLKLIHIITKEFRDENFKKTIPSWMLYEKKENICAFLNGLFSSDGTVMIRSGRSIVRLTNTEDSIIEKSKKMLYLVGISNSSFKETKPNRYKNKISKTYSKHLVIKDILAFKEKVGFILDRKQKRLDLINLHKSKINYYHFDFDLSKVKKVEKIRYNDYVYDLEIADVHRFFANNVLVHNTDSVFFKANTNNYEEAEKLGKKLTEEINKFFEIHIKEGHGIKNHLELEFEKVYKMFIMPKIRGAEAGAKKRYAGLRVINDEEKIEFTGMESKRRDWTELAKNFQHELLNRIFHKQEIAGYVRKFIEDVKKGKYDEQLIYRKSIRKDLGKYQVNAQHVKAAQKLDKVVSNIIEYVITEDGPEPIQAQKHKVDYDHYINKQLKPIADSILVFYNKKFDDLIKGSKQASLFNF